MKKRESPRTTPTKKSPLKQQKISPTTQKINELRSYQKTAIANLNFKQAEEYQKQILSLSHCSKSDQITAIQDDFQKTVITIADTYQSNLEKNEELRKKEDFEFRVRINTSFEELKEKHIKEMVDLEKGYAAMRLHETQRTCPEYEELITQAKFAGSVGDFEGAEDLQTEAMNIAQIELEKRLAKIDEDFNTKTDLLRDNHAREIILLVKRLEAGIKKVNDSDDARKKQEWSIFEAKIISEFQKAIKKVIHVLQNEESTEIQRNLEIIIARILEERKLPQVRNLCKTVRATSKLHFPKAVGRRNV
ncbi:hypothetical protein TRFO_42591 [Tritrichomonas foetus]|uniref:Uncharacterized protein n=1 Tax=Tritrichomonas foetus TaxID=1144522 RepID=A0A1J4KW15_9EUKA|nr:hypothetical protein TRFO_42591 [Tritrichomonas foetus]|eukprot:OHT15330.1 hypothetical protein TRFO_42591 [Tritrichomonas foetus]